MVKDQRGFCSICGIESYRFDLDSKVSIEFIVILYCKRQFFPFIQGYKQHTRDEHNMWNYMHYSHFVGETPRDKRSAVEKYVADTVSEP